MEFSNNINDDWLLEKVERLPSNNWVYLLACILTFRPIKKFTYQQLYMFFMAINFNEVNDVEEENKKSVMIRVLDIYYFNNKKLPFNLDD